MKKTEEIRSVTNIFNKDTDTTYSDTLSIATVYSCVRLLTNSIAAIDLKHMSEDGEVIQGSRIAKLLKQPQASYTTSNWVSNLVQDLVYRGNAYFIILDKELVHIPESQVQIYITTEEEAPFYYQITSKGKSFRIWPENMLHFRNITDESIIGINPIRLHNNTFDSALSMQEYQSKFVDNSSAISGVIQTPKKLQKETIEQLRLNFAAKYSGAANAGKIPVLAEGMEFKQTQRISPIDMDYINSAKLTKANIAEIYQVPLSMLGTSDLSYNNAESNSLMFQNYTLKPILKNIQQEMTLKLIKDKSSIQFLPNSIESASTKEKSDSLSLLVNTGIMTPNEARKQYGLPGIQGGDKVQEQQRPSEVGNAQQAPKNTDNTNPPKNVDTPPSKRSK